ncbi:MAG: hypothetical protein R3F43_04250 [bacterium]
MASCRIPPTATPPELCPRELQNVELNDFDDDCDREVDEGPLYRMVDGQPVPFDELSCNTDLPGVCATGQPDCRGGEEICIPVIRPGQIDEICDGLDNDWDGVVDENTVLDPMPEVGRACDSWQPGCARRHPAVPRWRAHLCARRGPDAGAVQRQR